MNVGWIETALQGDGNAQPCLRLRPHSGRRRQTSSKSLQMDGVVVFLRFHHAVLLVLPYADGQLDDIESLQNVRVKLSDQILVVSDHLLNEDLQVLIDHLNVGEFVAVVWIR